MENKKNISSEETEMNSKSGISNDKLEALMLNDESSANDSDYDKAEKEYGVFMAEYRDLISKSLTDIAAHEMTEQDHSQIEGQETMDIPSKEVTKSARGENSEWSDEITLEPQEYHDMPEEETSANGDASDDAQSELGENYQNSEDDNQISINFNEEIIVDEPKPEYEPEVRKYDPDKPRFIDWIFDIAEIFVFVLCAVMIITGILFRHSIVVGESMKTTLDDGDHLIISDVFYTPSRGDIIVFEDYSTPLHNAVIKRVIGLPGETVEVLFNEDGSALVIKIDGEIIDDSHAYYGGGQLTVCPPVTLGENEVFVLGDNRCNSTDSRNASVGPINIDAILGKLIVRIYPIDKFGTVK